MFVHIISGYKYHLVKLVALVKYKSIIDLCINLIKTKMERKSKANEKAMRLEM